MHAIRMAYIGSSKLRRGGSEVIVLPFSVIVGSALFDQEEPTNESYFSVTKVLPIGNLPNIPGLRHR
jgi:hypothetical protein